MNDKNEFKLVIPPSTVISVIGVLVSVWLLYQVREIVFLFLAVVAIVVAFSPLIKWLQKYMPRTVAIIFVYIVVTLVLLAIVGLIVPPIIYQLNDFIHFLQSHIADLGLSQSSLNYIRDNVGLISQGHTFEALGQIIMQFKGSFGAFYSSTIGFVGGVIAAVTVFITSFYLLQEEKNFHNFISSLVPFHQRDRVALIADRISDKMGDWLRGQLLLMIIVGVMDGLALWILGSPYPLLLGLWAGLTEAIPFVGPFIGAIPAVFIVFTTLGLAKGVIAMIIYFVVQQIESNFLVPRIMGRALGISPVVIIFSLLIGGKLFGLLGVILAVPVTAALSVIYEEWRKEDSKS